jgi:two-component system response regulator
MFSDNSRPDILLVEDNPNDVELALHAFRKYKVTNSICVIRDGEEALEYFSASGRYSSRNRHDLPRLVLLDIKLPLVNGIDVLEEIKKDPITRQLPVVMMTSSRLDSDLDKSYELGANSYIVKPVDLEQFLEVVRNLGLYWLTLNEPPK